MTAAVQALRYLRVSRTDQNVALQDDDTIELIKRRGWALVDTYIDHGVSGAREKCIRCADPVSRLVVPALMMAAWNSGRTQRVRRSS